MRGIIMFETDARIEILKYGKRFATTLYGMYELQFEPHLMGSMIHVSSKVKDDRTGTWLLAEAPTDFILALGNAAKILNKSK